MFKILNGNLFPALGAPGFQNARAPGCSGTLAKTVRFASLPFLWLISYAHNVIINTSSFYIKNQKKQCSRQTFLPKLRKK
jgi:hypothetical protein